MLLLVACGDRERSAATGRAASADPDSAGSARARIGVVFDPLRVRVGDSVAGLAITRVDVRPAAVDSSAVGSITFDGLLQLDGRTIAHFDADARDASCFEADSSSAARMPRWEGDTRRAWFCFSNAAVARQALGAPERRARIAIDQLVIHRGHSDQVNEARFVRALR